MGSSIFWPGSSATFPTCSAFLLLICLKCLPLSQQPSYYMPNPLPCHLLKDFVPVIISFLSCIINFCSLLTYYKHAPVTYILRKIPWPLYSPPVTTLFLFSTQKTSYMICPASLSLSPCLPVSFQTTQSGISLSIDTTFKKVALTKSSAHAISVVSLVLSAAFVHRVDCSFLEKHSFLDTGDTSCSPGSLPPFLALSPSPGFTLFFCLTFKC